MLSRRLGYLASSRNFSALTRPHIVLNSAPSLFRNYALSRFDRENYRPGGGRARPNLSRREIRDQDNTTPKPEEKEDADFDIWDASQRPPSSNPEEGLKKLLLGNNKLVVTRQLEMLNIFLGFEQTNKYVITNEQEETLGYIAEEPRGIFAAFSRQLFRTHRPFRAIVMDAVGTPVLWLRRPFAFINSRMYVQRLKDYNAYTPDGEPVLDTFAEVQQRWHFWRRRYDLYLREENRRILSVASDPQPEPEPDSHIFNQFSKIDAGFLAWDFPIHDARSEEIASVNRTWRGFGRELFTDTGSYYVNFEPLPLIPDESVPEESTPPTSTVIRDLTLEERALVLASAVNIDFDFFSRHSEGSGGMGLHMGSLWPSEGVDV